MSSYRKSVYSVTALAILIAAALAVWALTDSKSPPPQPEDTRAKAPCFDEAKRRYSHGAVFRLSGVRVVCEDGKTVPVE